eukprot:sb/3476686/
MAKLWGYIFCTLLHRSHDPSKRLRERGRKREITGTVTEVFSRFAIAIKKCRGAANCERVPPKSVLKFADNAFKMDRLSCFVRPGTRGSRVEQGNGCQALFVTDRRTLLVNYTIC